MTEITGRSRRSVTRARHKDLHSVGERGTALASIVRHIEVVGECLVVFVSKMTSGRNVSVGCGGATNSMVMLIDSFILGEFKATEQGNEDEPCC